MGCGGSKVEATANARPANQDLPQRESSRNSKKKKGDGDWDEEDSLSYSGGSSVPSKRPSKSAGFQYIADKKTGEQHIQWLKGDMIGSGAFGRVYLGMNPVNGELVCCKEMVFVVNDQELEKRDKMIATVQKEVDTLKKLNGHPNIVTFIHHEFVMREGMVRIFMEYCPCGSLTTVLKKFGALPVITVSCYTRQILSGLSHLHKHHVVHRDIKPSNVLLDVNGMVKLADFGAAKTLTTNTMGATASDMNTLTGTPTNLAPEVITENNYGQKVDVWSLGCTVLELATARQPWSEYIDEVNARGGGGPGQTPVLLMHIANQAKQVGAGPHIPEDLSDLLKDFLRQCFVVDPKERPRVRDLQEHAMILRYASNAPGTAAAKVLGQTFRGGKANEALPWNGQAGQQHDTFGFNTQTHVGEDDANGFQTTNNGHLAIGDSFLSPTHNGSLPGKSPAGKSNQISIGGKSDGMKSDSFAMSTYASSNNTSLTDLPDSSLNGDMHGKRGDTFTEDDDDDDDDGDDDDESDDDEDDVESMSLDSKPSRSPQHTPLVNPHDNKPLPKTIMAEDHLLQIRDEERRKTAKQEQAAYEKELFEKEQAAYRERTRAELKLKKKR